jgi:hypothetical protein
MVYSNGGCSVTNRTLNREDFDRSRFRYDNLFLNLNIIFICA